MEALCWSLDCGLISPALRGNIASRSIKSSKVSASCGAGLTSPATLRTDKIPGGCASRTSSSMSVTNGFEDQSHVAFYGRGRRPSSDRSICKALKGKAKDLEARAGALTSAAIAGTGSQEMFTPEAASSQQTALMQDVLRELSEIKAELKAIKKRQKKMDTSSSSSSSSSESCSSSDGDMAPTKSKKGKKNRLQFPTMVAEQSSTTLQGTEATVVDYVLPAGDEPETASEMILRTLGLGHGIHGDQTIIPARPSNSSLLEASAQPVDSRGRAGRESLQMATLEVCTGGKCRKNGAHEILAKLQNKIPSTSNLTVSGCGKCMGKCKTAPNVKVRREESNSIMYNYVAEHDVDAILSEHLHGHATGLPSFAGRRVSLQQHQVLATV